MKEKYSAVIFDLDGTLLNTLADLTAAVNATMSALNAPLRTEEEVRSFVGNGVPKLLERALPSYAADKTEAAYTFFTAYYGAHNADRTAPYAGVLPLVTALKTAGVKTAVVTNKSEGAACSLVDKFFPGVFSAVVGGRADLPKKPAPDGALIALERLGADKSGALYVGDSDVDYYTAKNAGLDCALVTWGFRPQSALSALQPTYLCKSAKELEHIILKKGE